MSDILRNSCLGMIATDFAQQNWGQWMQNNVDFATTFDVLCGSRGMGKAGVSLPSPFSPPWPQVCREGLNHLVEGLTLQIPPPQQLIFFPFLDTIKQT